MRLLLLSSLLLVGCVPTPRPSPVAEAGVSRPEAGVSRPEAGQLQVCCSTQVGDSTITSHGCGALIELQGRTYIATATHVVRDYLAGTAKLDIGFPFTAGPATTNGDLCLIPVTTAYRGWPATSVFGPRAGDTITSQGLGRTFTGTISSIAVHSTMPVESGLSGAPVFWNGKIVGITVAIINTTESNGRVTSGGMHLLF